MCIWSRISKQLPIWAKHDLSKIGRSKHSKKKYNTQTHNTNGTTTKKKRRNSSDEHTTMISHSTRSTTALEIIKLILKIFVLLPISLFPLALFWSYLPKSGRKEWFDFGQNIFLIHNFRNSFSIHLVHNTTEKINLFHSTNSETKEIRIESGWMFYMIFGHKIIISQ